MSLNVTFFHHAQSGWVLAKDNLQSLGVWSDSAIVYAIRKGKELESGAFR